MRDAIRSRAARIMSILSINSFGIKSEFKHFGEVGNEPILHDAQRRLVAKQFFHGSDGLTFASDYQVKVTEICIHVQRKAVGGDPAGDVNSNGRDFAALSMNSSQTGNAKRLDAEVFQRANQNLFQITDVTMNVFAVGTEINNRITNHLAHAVISHFAATIRFKQSNVPLF